MEQFRRRFPQLFGLQAPVAATNAGDGDPDPVVFPGQRISRLSDYVRLLRGMQSGNIAGALASMGLDMNSYGAVASAWGQRLAQDPSLSQKMQRMMQQN
jgi:hypothetical protein